ncbi:MAG: hypothetical protein AB8D78_02220 [Akkermansiaceae bacterium]
MKILAVFATVFFALSAFAAAQNNQRDPNNNTNDPENSEATDKEGRKGYWEANVSGGNYVVALSRITSVSRHEYVLDGSLIVDEVTVDTQGQALARFYFIRPVTDRAPGTAVGAVTERTLGLIEQAAQRKGSTVQDMVVKKYPLTTHAKTIEYRLLSEAQLGVLYGSVKTAWQTGRGRIFSGR